MGKKSQKQQPKQPNATTGNHVDTIETTSVLTTASVTVLPVNTTATTPAPAPYKPITDTVSIERLVGLAKDSPPDSALGIVWCHAYEDGYENGRISLLQNLKKKLEDKYEEGREQGIREGKERYYGKGIVRGEYDEHEKWKAEGHGQHCFTAVAFREDAGVQSSPTTANISTSYSTSGIQTSPLATVLHATADHLVQTNSVSIQTSCDIMITQLPLSVLSPSLSVPATSSASQASIGTQTETITSQHVETGRLTRVLDTSQPPVPSKYGKNAKMDSTPKISQTAAIFSSTTLSATVLNQSAPPTAIIALETHPTMADFAQKPEKPPNSNQITEPNPSPCTSCPTDDITRAYASPLTQNDDVLKPKSAPTTNIPASSSHLPASSGPEKSALSRAISESQKPMVFPAPTSVVTALETRSESVESMGIHQKTKKPPFFTQKAKVSDNSKCANDIDTPPAFATIIPAPETPSATARFKKNYQNVEKSPFFTQKPPEPSVSTRFDWADDAESLPISSTVATKYSRDLTCLRSSSSKPFSSLRRRRRNYKNSQHFSNSWSQPRCQHTFWNPHYHSSTLHTPYNISQPPSALLNWDQDPRLADLSAALRALGWIRQ